MKVLTNHSPHKPGNILYTSQSCVLPKVLKGSFPAVQPISDDYTLSLWLEPDYEGLSSATTGHSGYSFVLA